MIRRATHEDVDRIVQMGARFISSTTYQDLIPVKPQAMRAWVHALVGCRVGAQSAVFVSEHEGELVAMLALFVYENPLSQDLEAVEPFWWVEPEHRGRGVRLLKHAERWAKEAGALTLRMIAPTEEVERLYERMGFRRIETNYARAL